MSDNQSPSLPEDTRQRILYAAQTLFSQRGYTSTTTQAIADEADVNEVTLFRHFGSKRNLLSAMVQRYSALPDLTNLVQEQLSGDYRQDLITLGSIFLGVITERRDAMRLMLCEANEFDEVREVMVQIPDQIRGIVSDYFDQKIEQGYLREGNPEIMAQGFLGMFFSYAIARHMLASSIAPEVPQEALVAQFVDIFVQGTLRE